MQSKKKLRKLINYIKKSNTITIILSLIVIGEIIIHDNKSPINVDNFTVDDVSCYNTDIEGDLSVGSNWSFPEKSIFFLVTSCKGGIDTRQACSIESAARAHPKWQVNVLFIGPAFKRSQRGETISRLQQYANIKFARVNLTEYVEGTPLESLFAGDNLKESIFPVHHNSDVLRYLTLYKFGGVYLDLDVIVARSLDDLGGNWVARQSDKMVAAGALAISKDKIGRRVAEATIRDIKSDFQPLRWLHNSVGVITRALKKTCLTSEVKHMSSVTCQGFGVLEPKYFYPVHFSSWRSYFKSGELQKHTYGYHFWNKLSHNAIVPKHSLFAKLAERYCSTTFKMYRDEFGS